MQCRRETPSELGGGDVGWLDVGWLGVADAMRSTSEERQCHWLRALTPRDAVIFHTAPSKWQEANFKLAR